MSSEPTSDRSAVTRATVLELLRRIGGGDVAAIAAMYAERVDWKVSWPEAELGRLATPWIRDRYTRDDAATHFRQLGEHHVPEDADTRVDHVLVDGADAVVLGEIRQTARPTGNAYRARFALHVTVQDGQVTRHHVYEDSLGVAQAFSPSRG